MDLPADFYLDTIRKVFLEHRLATGKMMFEDQQIDTKSVKNVALLTIEGENDDITGNGQTKAAHDVLSSIPDSLKMHYEQPNVGHYGIFNGRRFRQEVSPVIKDFIKKHADTAQAKVEEKVEEKAQPTPAKTASVTADTPSEKPESSKPAAPKTTTRAKRATSAKATTSKTETTARKTTAKRATPAKATATKPAQPSAAKKAASSTAKAPETKTVTDTAADKATKA